MPRVKISVYFTCMYCVRNLLFPIYGGSWLEALSEKWKLARMSHYNRVGEMDDRESAREVVVKGPVPDEISGLFAI